MIRTRLLLVTAGLGMMLTDAASAQIAIDKAQRDRLDQPPVAGEAAPPAMPALRGRTTIESPALSRATVASVRLEGSSLPREAALSVVRSFVGAAITPDTLKAMADAYSAAYARSDIALYSIVVPEQTFKGGEVRIIAIENFIDEVMLAGDAPESASVTRIYAATMAADRPLSRPVLERYLLLMNDLPGVKTTPRVIAGDRADSVKLLLTTERMPVERVVTIDTRGAARLGRTQVQGDLYLNGWGYEGGRTRLSMSASADFDRFLSASASHAATFGPSGMTVSGSFGYFRTRPDDTPLEGQGYTASLQASYPLVRRVSSNISISAGIDGLNTDNALVGQLLSSDRTRALRGAVSASGQRGDTAWGTSLSVSQGLDAFGARVSNPARAETTFTKANVQLAATRKLDTDWRLRAAATAQLSSDALPLGELMSLGGAQFGRAFETGAASGDSGVAGSVELTRDLASAGLAPLKEAYIFLDGGRLWLTERPGLVDDTIALSSVGGGVRTSLSSELMLGVEAGKALEGAEDDGWRLSLSLGGAF
jgi:hemolysin activation/secretion protein